MSSRAVGLILLLTLIMQGVLLFRQVRGPAQKVTIRDAPNGTFLELKGLPSEGATNAKVVLVEFSDYECPFCARHENSVAPSIQKEFIQTGVIRHVFVNNPLAIHPSAKLMATAAFCAGQQEQYWKMHDLLFKEQPKTEDAILALAPRIGLESSALQQCIEASPAAAEQIERDLKAASNLELTGTPAFAIGAVEQGRVRIKKFVLGAQPFPVFQKTLKEVLAEDHAS